MGSPFSSLCLLVGFFLFTFACFFLYYFCFHVTQLRTEDFKLNRLHALQDNGTKQAPIKIVDVSPKPSEVNILFYIFI